MIDKKLKILLITGSYPPQICGVGDYTAKLLTFLQQNQNGNLTFDLFFKSEWSLKFFGKYFQEIKSRKSDFYHLQYPTEGYGYSLLPLLLFFFLPKKKTIVTVHELSSRNFLAYMYTLLLILFSGKVIVSNVLEQKHAERFLINKKKVKVIPIASNIKASIFSKRNFTDRKIDLACFGHIRPLKGIEDFIETTTLLNNSHNCAIIGQSLKRYESFFEDVKDKSKHLNIEVIANKDEDEIADILADVKIIYLPFPDGVSNRRGSLLASIQNGCTIITRASSYEQFNSFFERYCFLVNSNEEAGTIIDELLKGERDIKDTTDMMIAFSWDNVTKEHFAIYNS